MTGDRLPFARPAPTAAWRRAISRLGRIRETHAEDGRVPDHRQAWVNLHGPTAADDYDPAVLRQHAQVFGKINVRQHLQNDVRPLCRRSDALASSK